MCGCAAHKPLPTHRVLLCESRENSLTRSLQGKNRSLVTSYRPVNAPTRFIVTDLSWRRLTRSTGCVWLNLAPLLPTGRRGEPCRSSSQEKIITESPPTGEPSARGFHRSPAHPGLQ